MFPSVDGFQILKEIGKGGMGTVYLAREEAQLLALGGAPPTNLPKTLFDLPPLRKW